VSRQHRARARRRRTNGAGGHAALIIVNVGVSAAKAPLVGNTEFILSGAGAAAGIAMINSVGNLGGFRGPLRDRLAEVANGQLRERSVCRRGDPRRLCAADMSMWRLHGVLRAPALLDTSGSCDDDERHH